MHICYVTPRVWIGMLISDSLTRKVTLVEYCVVYVIKQIFVRQKNRASSKSQENPIKVTSDRKPVIGLRLYLEGNKRNCLAMRVQHLSIHPNTIASFISSKQTTVASTSVFVAAWIVSCWILTGERQTAVIRSRYVEVLLNQDMSFFYTYGNNGDIVRQVLSDVLLIQSALSEKIALITLASCPLIVAAGGISNIFLHRLAINIQDAYAEAASIAEQVTLDYHGSCNEKEDVLATTSDGASFCGLKCQEVVASQGWPEITKYICKPGLCTSTYY
ncbi:hypothetical protein CASFOL_032211 [Castilleja foliolosa]|uniref:ABC transmembrane type-1 domain-containing protein n=1 Tax=Castilleja foliolosa TaxID=1961234 RepID=A0ABD3C3F4_9LAMI